MSRGVIYYIGVEGEIGNYSAMDESAFYDSLAHLGVDYVKNQTDEDSKYSVENLISRLQATGLKVEPHPEAGFAGFYTFKTGAAAETLVCKTRYFAAAFSALQKMMCSISLETFASDGMEEFELRRLINNQVEDAVYFGEYIEGVYSLDSFIRKLTPNTAYYIAPETVYMH